MAFILRNTEDGGNDIIALHETVQQLKEDRRTSYINEDEYVVRFEGDHYLYKGDCKNAFIQIITDINGKDKYEQIRLNNTKDGFSFIHFPVFSNLKTLRVLTEFDKIGQDFEFETPKFSYL